MGTSSQGAARMPPALVGKRFHPGLERIEVVRDLPDYLENLTAKWQFSYENQLRIAVLKLHEDHEVAVLWTNRSEDYPLYKMVLQRLHEHNLHLEPSLQIETGEAVLAELARKPEAQADEENIIRQQAIDLAARALSESASDIHLEVTSKTCDVWFRIHGDLFRQPSLSRTNGETMTNVLYWMAEATSRTGSSPDPTNTPQDAKIERTIKVGSRLTKTTIRYASIPVEAGWDVTLRLLPESSEGPRSLEQLGYDEAEIAAILRMLSKPRGYLGIVGTTGSGKTTSLQSMLTLYHKLNDGRKKTRTLEDPVELRIPGARQTSVRRDANGNADFPTYLKATLRNDPDALMVGEIRDEETGKVLQQAVQTGHTGFGTLHAGDVFDGIDRLADLGIERSIMASGDLITGLIYQRLVPVLCPHCKLDINHAMPVLARDHLERCQRTFGAGITNVRWRGHDPNCKHCKGRGIVDQTVAAQILYPDRLLASMFGRSDEGAIARAYWRSGLVRVPDDVQPTVGRTALDQAIKKAKWGSVSPLDVEARLGRLDSEASPAEERAFLSMRRPDLLLGAQLFEKDSVPA
ncbi:MAG: Flp pilus assembly complex ATPase component TadA [Aquimonas sp.]|nr:Flp pilus assembly complex ATPase component TadA [Aquimonas sp.]